MKAQSDHSDSLVFECDLDEPPEKVWRALTEPRLLEAWLTMDDSPASASGAEPAAVPADRSRGKVGSSDYQIMAAEPNRLLRYRCRDREVGIGDAGDREVHSVVTIELAPCPSGGTHLRLTHGEFRIVSAMMPMPVARVRAITGAGRQRAPILSFAPQTSWRRAA